MPDPSEVAEFVIQRARQDPKVRKIVEDVRLFDKLQEDVSWRRLAEEVRAGHERCLRDIAKRQMSSEIVSQREIDYNRGFYDGARWIIEIPAEAAKSLERAARKAWLDAQLEIEKQAEEDSPYISASPPVPTSQEDE